MAGQIIPRGAGTWLVRVYIGRDTAGKRTYLNKTIRGTKKDAQRWLTSTLRDRDLGVAIQPAANTLDEYLTRWLQDAAKAKLRRKTFAGYEQILNTHVRPALGSRPLSKIRPLEIQSLYNAMRDQGLSPRTIQYTNMILKQAFKQALRWQMLVFNPCDGIELPRQQRKEMSVLSPEQARRFIAAARADRYGALFELAITTGLRPSEYLALKWSDLDISRGVLSINRSMERLPGGGWEFADNKTGRSRRTVKLHRSVLDSLANWRRTQEAECAAAREHRTDNDLVFTNEGGGPIDRHNLARRNFRTILKDAGLPRMRLYDLRHTAATLALSAGVPVKVVSEQLGHASAALTLDVYSHVLPHMQDDAVKRVEALLIDGGTPPHPETRDPHTIGTQRPN